MILKNDENVYVTRTKMTLKNDENVYVTRTKSNKNALFMKPKNVIICYIYDICNHIMIRFRNDLFLHRTLEIYCIMWLVNSS